MLYVACESLGGLGAQQAGKLRSDFWFSLGVKEGNFGFMCCEGHVQCRQWDAKFEVE